MARSYFASLLSGGRTAALCVGLILYGLLLLGAAGLLRHRRIRAA